jgi:hypothetical protein
MLKLIDLAPEAISQWTVGASADDAGIGDLDVRRVIALRPQEWADSDEPVDLEEFFETFYPGVVYWPVDWDNDFQLRGRLFSCHLKQLGFKLRYPTTHHSPRIVKPFGEQEAAGEEVNIGLKLASSWFTWGDEVVSATDGVVVEAGWHGNRGGVGHRVRVKTTAPDGNEVLIRYAPMAGYDGIYVGIGDTVTAGQKLGRPGAIGVNTAEYLHIDVKVDGVFVDPVMLIEWPEGEASSLETAEAKSSPRDDLAGFLDGERQSPGAAKAHSHEVFRDGGSGSGVIRLPAAVLLPRIEDTAERLDWRIAAAIGASEQMSILGQPLDDGLFELCRGSLIAVNPATWGEHAPAWLGQRSEDMHKAMGRQGLLEIVTQLLPGQPLEGMAGEQDEDSRVSTDLDVPRTEHRVVEAGTPWEMAVQLLPPLEDDIALAQTDRRWAAYDFGEHPDQNAETIGRYGCFLTALAIILRKVYQRDLLPPVLDKLLVVARAAYINDNIMAWEGAVSLFPVFDDKIKDNRRRSARELQRLMQDGWEIVLRRADGGHFVYLEAVEGDVLHIIDTWDGVRKQKRASNYLGIRAAHLKSGPAPPAPPKVLVGLHDQAGGEWMVQQGIEGCCLAHYAIQRRPTRIDCTHLQDAGITVVCRLNWGYAGGAGTLPRPKDRAAFVDAVVDTMVSARGVDYFHVGNEPNNRQEWPGFGSADEFALTPEYVTDIYNEVWHRVAGRAKIGPPPIDPYFGPNSNNRDWWDYMLNNITGADALFLHAKTQTNDPAEIWSRQRFVHEPLTWQYMHLRTVETTLEVVPSRFDELPVYVTELNPQHRTRIGGELGWVPDNAEWVRQALEYFREERPVAGVMFYRYEQAGDQKSFGLENASAILSAIAQEADA